MIILRCAVLLATALTLSNCCLSSSGCSNGPVAMTTAPAPIAARPVAAAPAAWDGLNEEPIDNAEADVDVTPPKKHARRRASVDAMSSQSSTGSRGNVNWDDQQALDRAEDARLRNKLIICKNCSTSQ
jgi:Flp pilus assembly protein TadG